MRSARRARDLTQAELAEIIGIAKETLSSWERNEQRPRSEAYWPKITEVLGLSRAELEGRGPGLSLLTADAPKGVRAPAQRLAEPGGASYGERVPPEASPAAPPAADVEGIQTLIRDVGGALARALDQLMLLSEVPGGDLERRQKALDSVRRLARELHGLGVDTHDLWDAADRLEKAWSRKPKG